LADIYADPVLAQAVTTYPTSKGIITVPKVEVTGQVTNPDGTVSTYKMPRSTQNVRGAQLDIDIQPSVSNNLFSLAGSTSITSTTTRINKRYFMITTLDVSGTAAPASGFADTTTTVSVNVRPDARGQIHKEMTFTDANGLTVTGVMTGHIDWDSSVVIFNVSITNPTGMTYTVNYATSKVVFSPRTGDVGRVKVKTKIGGWDVDIDTRDDFEIELDTETIQD
jgi:hypothetical protein